MDQQIEQFNISSKKKSKKVIVVIAFLGLFILFIFFNKESKPIFNPTKSDPQFQELITSINSSFPNIHPSINLAKKEKETFLFVNYETSENTKTETGEIIKSYYNTEVKEIVLLIGRQNITNYDILNIRITKKNPTENDHPMTIILTRDEVIEFISNPNKPLLK